ncbi:hypothetical protein MMAGJ_57780 [Mycolicibacterium mageritense]|uniref:eCIS core domain-containing protein n=2 Tax=Mycobacteriaceae TaxID=1762 RepID=A0ABM7I0T0_MYCME|nr:hypothetical protein MMAGJ_57780 [Mycolicibacterium mageritense]
MLRRLGWWEARVDYRVGTGLCTLRQPPVSRPIGQPPLPAQARFCTFPGTRMRRIVDGVGEGSEASMRTHDSDHGRESELRPKASRLEEPESALAMKAALSGRLDVAGPAGLAGLQRTAGNAGTSALMDEDRSPVHDVVASGGSPLPADLRTDMEGRFGHDFGDVRVHNDAAAHRSATSVNAQAYTVGSNIVFQSGKYDPASDAGKHMIAHELTHVVQQRSGPVDGTDAGGGVKISDPSDRFEREAVANADHVMAAPAPVSAPAAGVQRIADTAAVQREEAPEEEETAQTFVQRQDEEAEEESA